MGFIGRSRELAELDALVATIRRGHRDRPGTAVLLRGRRRVGKSRLATEFVHRSGLPSVYFAAARGADPIAEFAVLAQSVAESDLPDASLATDSAPQTLTAALTLLASALPDDSPSVVVLDELPWLLEQLPGGAGELQRVWDRRLSEKPVVLLMLGSDISAMEQLTRPDAPFHARATEMVLRALNPAEVGQMTATRGVDAFDAYLVTGGQPLVAQEWEPGLDLTAFLTSSYQRATSALVVSGNQVLDGELGITSAERAVLTAIGGRGERSFSAIRNATGASPLSASTVEIALGKLRDRRLVAIDEPLGFTPGNKTRRYRVADPALRYWLAFVAPAQIDVDRGRADLALKRHQTGFEAWRGRVIEPVVREALLRLLPNDDWPDIRAIGGWWPRTNTPEIDLVAADARPASTINFIGTIKWRPTHPVTVAEIQHLTLDASSIPHLNQVPPTVAVCPAGAEADTGAQAVWTADDLLAAWPGD
ncbi:MAG: AAA family ATPase [Propionibacteriaceae bacterium]|jgi:AAA+ ATPase superfamily predicted ATPase|nr:AAA family ATPase [Propionibacteriaceae bacterium]